jgi:hypothetical protein
MSNSTLYVSLPSNDCPKAVEEISNVKIANSFLFISVFKINANGWRYRQQALAGFRSLSLHCGCCGVVSFRLPLHPLVDYTMC